MTVVWEESMEFSLTVKIPGRLRLEEETLKCSATSVPMEQNGSEHKVRNFLQPTTIRRRQERGGKQLQHGLTRDGVTAEIGLYCVQTGNKNKTCLGA